MLKLAASNPRLRRTPSAAQLVPLDCRMSGGGLQTQELQTAFPAAVPRLLSEPVDYSDLFPRHPLEEGEWELRA